MLATTLYDSGPLFLPLARRRLSPASYPSLAPYLITARFLLLEAFIRREVGRRTFYLSWATKRARHVIWRQKEAPTPTTRMKPPAWDAVRGVAVWRSPRFHGCLVRGTTPAGGLDWVDGVGGAC